eukprot:gnl/MRDRNA2_/MRDRNA2_25665_c0_seq1.p1 gnl/MRDRNA2_/MRDRNA2_25665_c0~~gnl/MRDRNA2_/MRDRNA2_25665_c0_seq1.p1  ORF type:complete len:511 (-),score=90.18 gnl/MRDRNA2_/MRDRNA2_25665_c0_seq1:26-1402(-)
MPLLVEDFAAKASLKQRCGRAGRVQAGTCYKLISKKTFLKLSGHGTPEIQRCALDHTLLSLMFIGVEEGSGNFFRTLLDPPSQDALDAAIESLQKLGALSKFIEGKVELTPLGRNLAGIPSPPIVGKLLIMGSILGCRNGALAMAAGMSAARSPFFRIEQSSQQSEEAEGNDVDTYKNKRILLARKTMAKKVGYSDHTMLAAVYLDWDSTNTYKDREKYCEVYGLSFHGMNEMRQLVRQLDSSLSVAGYVSSQGSNRFDRCWDLLRACVVAALAPSHVVKVQAPIPKSGGLPSSASLRGGVVGEPWELKFFVLAPKNISSEGELPSTNHRVYDDFVEEQVFLHPSAASFTKTRYTCPWLVYHELVQTSKKFLRDASECSAYSLLLFGGKIEVQARNDLIIVEDWINLAANARIGALIDGLRKKIDELLKRKSEKPEFDISSTAEIKLVCKLLMTDGHG